MFKLLHGKLFDLKAFGQNSSPVHFKCSLAFMLQRGYWDLGTLCTCPFSNPLTHVPDRGQIESPAISIETWLHRINNTSILRATMDALEHKKSVVRTLMHRANCIVSDEKEREKEIDHIKVAFTMNDYPAWMLVKENGERKKNLGKIQGHDEAFSTSGKWRIPVKILYICGLSEQVQWLYKNSNVHPYVLQAF